VIKYICVFFLISEYSMAEIAPMSSPIFLRPGFSTVLEFGVAPTHVVIGDAASFQVERLNTSLVLKTLAFEASSNMLVYFNNSEPRVFILTASEDAEPTLYKKVGAAALPNPPASNTNSKQVSGKTAILNSKFDAKKDYLTVEYTIAAKSDSQVIPLWESVYIKYGETRIETQNSWSERKVVQRDTTVRARAIFTTPDVPRNLNGVQLVIPLKDSNKKLILSLKG
jgi:hypothetical protein